MSFFKDALSIFFLAFCLLNSSSAQPAEKIKPEDLGGRWQVDGYEIDFRFECSISRRTFIPTKVCGKPYIVIYRQRATGADSIASASSSFFLLTAKEISVGDKWVFNDYAQQKKTPFAEMAASGWGPRSSEELLLLLMDAPDTHLKFMTRTGSNSAIKTRMIILSEFKQNTEEQIRRINYNFDREESSERFKMLLGVALLVIFLSIALWATAYLVKRGRQQLKIIKEQVDTRRVARVAEDEAVREVVRSSVQKVDDSSLQALRSQIKAALDSGDTKTAGELLEILKQLNRKQH